MKGYDCFHARHVFSKRGNRIILDFILREKCLFYEKSVFFMRKVSFFKQKFGFPPKNRNVGNINNEIVHTNEKKLTSTSSLMLSRLEDLEFATLSLVRALWRAQLYK